MSCCRTSVKLCDSGGLQSIMGVVVSQQLGILSASPVETTQASFTHRAVMIL